MKEFINGCILTVILILISPIALIILGYYAIESIPDLFIKNKKHKRNNI